MNKTKVARDLIIVALCIVVAVFIARKMADQNAADQPVPGTTAEMPMDHPGSSSHMAAAPALDAGAVAITLDENVVGSEWLDTETGLLFSNATSKGITDYTQAKARQEAVAEGVLELVILKALKDNGLELTEEDMEERKAIFIESSGGEDAADELMGGMGVTWERMYKLWEAELIEIKMKEHVAGLNDLAVDSDEVDNAFDEWLWGLLVDAEPVFTDAADEAKFLEHVVNLEMIRQAGHGDTGNPHGGMMGGMMDNGETVPADAVDEPESTE